MILKLRKTLTNIPLGNEKKQRFVNHIIIYIAYVRNHDHSISYDASFINSDYIT